MGSDGGAPERPQDETRGQKAQPRRKFHLLRSRRHCSSSNGVVVEAVALATQRPTKVSGMIPTSGSRYGMPGSAVLAVTSSCVGSVGWRAPGAPSSSKTFVVCWGHQGARSCATTPQRDDAAPEHLPTMAVISHCLLTFRAVTLTSSVNGRKQGCRT
jgi:hypothetical protein